MLFFSPLFLSPLYSPFPLPLQFAPSFPIAAQISLSLPPDSDICLAFLTDRSEISVLSVNETHSRPSGSQGPLHSSNTLLKKTAKQSQ